MIVRTGFDRTTLVWLSTLVSLSAFVANTRLGTPAIAVFFGVWLLMLAAWPTFLVRAFRFQLLPWMLPALALASTVWSSEPATSMRLAIELTLCTSVGLLVAQAQTPRRFVAALLIALLVGAFASVLFNETTIIQPTGEVAMTGIFKSKNNFASFMCLLLLCSIAVLADPSQGRAKRVLAILGLLLAPFLLWRAHSLGALLACGAGAVTTLGIICLGRLPPRARTPTLVMLLVVAAAALVTGEIALASGFNVSQLLVSFGKDPSLTGRTYLWQRAAEYIGVHPFAGIGYQSFWVQGHVEAEGLWRYAHVEARGGFHFHNLYYETAVELGWSGVVALGTFLLCTSAATLAAGVLRPTPTSALFAGLVVFFLMRVSVELDFLAPFATGSLLLPIFWVYAKSSLRSRVL